MLENEIDIEEVISVFKALSDPNRHRIFAELMKGNSCNCELEESLNLSRNLLSHHLRVLSNVGLIDSRKDAVDGRWIYYSVNTAAATRWQKYFNDYFNPERIQERPFCGPEGETISLEKIT